MKIERSIAYQIGPTRGHIRIEVSDAGLAAVSQTQFLEVYLAISKAFGEAMDKIEGIEVMDKIEGIEVIE